MGERAAKELGPRRARGVRGSAVRAHDKYCASGKKSFSKFFRVSFEAAKSGDRLDQVHWSVWASEWGDGELGSARCVVKCAREVNASKRAQIEGEWVVKRV